METAVDSNSNDRADCDGDDNVSVGSSGATSPVVTALSSRASAFSIEALIGGSGQGNKEKYSASRLTDGQHQNSHETDKNGKKSDW